MFVHSTKIRLGGNLVLLALMPLVFACSKSKFSAVKNQPAPVTQTQQPAPIVENPNTTYPIDNGCYNGNCGPTNPPPKPPPVVQPPCDPPPVIVNPPVEPPPYVEPPVVKPPPIVVPPPPPPPQDCKEYDYDVPAYNGPRAMNVWVVMDGSKSNVKERYSQLISLVTMYEQNLARSMPLTISFITGHSPESSDSVLGGKSLFYRHSSEPTVLRFYAGMSKSERDSALSALELKVIEMRRDNSSGISDGGELMTANLLAALKPSNLSRAAQAGAYGKGNILNIHFMSDENDICTKGNVPSTSVKNPETGKMTTREEYARYKHCGMMDVNSQGYSQTLFNELSALNQSGAAKIHLTGFIYTGENGVPHDGQNEVGHGMLELIQATGGRAFDLAALNGAEAYNKASLALAGHINKEGNLYVRYQLKDTKGQIVGLNNMNRKKSLVMVDGQQTTYRTDSNGNYIYLVGCPIDAKKVKIKYCHNQ